MYYLDVKFALVRSSLWASIADNLSKWERFYLHISLRLLTNNSTATISSRGHGPIRQTVDCIDCCRRFSMIFFNCSRKISIDIHLVARLMDFHLQTYLPTLLSPSKQVSWTETLGHHPLKRFPCDYQRQVSRRYPRSTYQIRSYCACRP